MRAFGNGAALLDFTGENTVDRGTMLGHTARGSFPEGGFPLDFIATLIGGDAAEAAYRDFGSRAGRGAPRTLDFAATWKMLAAHVKALGDESHGVAQPGAPLGNFELMCDAMLHGRNLADGLARMVRFARVMNTDMQLETRAVRGKLYLSGLSRAPFSIAREAYTDGFAMVLHCVLRWTMGRPLHAPQAEFSAHLAPYGSCLSMYACRVQTREEGFLVAYDEADAQAPFLERDAAGWLDGSYREFRRLLEEWHARPAVPPAEGDDIAERVRRNLIDKPAGQAEIARRLGMSVATLRRRLAESDRSFRGIAGAIKRDTAEMLLSTERTTHEIASDLGLSDSRCLRRACRTWFGDSPSEVRRTLLKSFDGKHRRHA